MEIITSNTEDDPLGDLILSGLLAYNDSQVPSKIEPFFVAIEDHGAVIAGAKCRSMYDWMFVELLWVADPQRGRGLGTQLILRIENEAIARGCVGVHLDTFSFQARGFYQKLGFEEFGVIADHPKGHSRHYLKKMLP